jgi:hypothetical protein
MIKEEKIPGANGICIFFQLAERQSGYRQIFNGQQTRNQTTPQIKHPHRKYITFGRSTKNTDAAINFASPAPQTFSINKTRPKSITKKKIHV